MTRRRAAYRADRRTTGRIYALRQRLWWDLGPARQAMLATGWQDDRNGSADLAGFVFMGRLRPIAIGCESLAEALYLGRRLRCHLFGA